MFKEDFNTLVRVCAKGGELMAVEMTHIFTWGNGEKRATLKGRECRILTHGKMRSVRVEFENGQLEIVDFRALRKKPLSKQLKLFPDKIKAANASRQGGFQNYTV